MLDLVRALWVSSDAVVNFAGLLASGMVCLYEGNFDVPITSYHVTLTEKGQGFVSAWLPRPCPRTLVTAFVSPHGGLPPP